jgi:Peptidase family M48
MFWRIIGQFLGVAVLSSPLASIGAAQGSDKEEVEQAFASMGAGATGERGTAEEMKRRLFTKRITVLGVASRAHAVAALNRSLRNRRITHGKLLRRVEGIFDKVLRLHEREGRVELFLYEDDRPSVKLWRGCVIVISAGLAEPLYDGELAGVFAHELGHSYFEDEMAAARVNQDARAMRVVELKCDGIAILSLKLLGYAPGYYLGGLRRLRSIAKTKGLSEGVSPSHPQLAERAKFSQRFIKSMR